MSSIKVLVVGDEGVGKTTLIHAFISQLPNTVEKTLKRVLLHPDMSIFSNQVFTQIIDTSANDTDFQTVMPEADIILLVYDVSSKQSINKMEDEWLPMIGQYAPNKPVILVGNKRDILQLRINESGEQSIKHQDVLKRMQRKFKNTQMIIQCSAYYNRNVKNVLHYAQRVVLYPLPPLYDTKKGVLTPKMIKAITRIFRILDKDLDGKLSTQELATLQQRVFESQLHTEDLRMIQNIIAEEQQLNNEDYITLNGFIILQKKIIQMLKIQIVWTILRYFHYNDNLELKIPSDKFFLNDGQAIELTSHASHYLNGLYDLAKKKNPQKLKSYIFECSPQLQVPLPQFEDQKISRQQFLFFWNYLAYVDYKKCYDNLIYIGYEGQLTQAFRKTKPKQGFSDMLHIKDRKILSVAIIDNCQSPEYLKNLFISTVQEDGISRHVRLISVQGHSKILILFKLNQQIVEKFLQSAFAKQIDLYLNFGDSRMDNINQKYIRQTIGVCYTMIRTINKREAQQMLRIFQLDQLDLNSFPVTYKKRSYDALFKVIADSFTNVQQVLLPQDIKQLKDKQKKSTIMIISGFALVGATAFALYWKYKSRT